MTQPMPTISVVIPLYNKREQIVRTVDSVLSQRYSANEIIVLDYGSSDGSARLIARERGNHIRLIQQLNVGVSTARNQGVEHARSDIVAFLDVEDTWEAHYLEQIVNLATDFPKASCFATAYQFLVDEGDYIDPKIRFPTRPKSSGLMEDYFAISAKGDLPFIMSSFCVKRCDFLQIGRFSEGADVGEDQDFFARAALKSKIAYSSGVHAFYHLGSRHRACLNNVPDQECDFSKKIYDWALNNTDNEKLKEHMIDYTAAHLLHLAALNIRLGKLRPAQQLLQDKRCQRHPFKHLWWSSNLLIKRAFSLHRKIALV